MNAIDQEVELFLQLWMAELSRSIEMFTGEEAKLSHEPAAPGVPDPEDLPEYLWWRQQYESDGGFAAWTGARERTWMAFGGLSGPAAQTKQTYLDILRQAIDGVCKTLTARAHWPVRCGAASEEAFSNVDSLAIFGVNISLRGESLPPLLVAVEETAGAVLRSAMEAGGRDEDEGAPALTAASPMLARLMDVEFPLAVALGRAVLPIRDILKMATGSLIELDRTVNDYVDLVVHGTVVARGEIVSVKGNYGVRIKEIISRQERMALRAGEG